MTTKLLLFVGICLLGSSSAILMDLYFRLRKIGINPRSIWILNPSLWIFIGAPREYLRVRNNYGWPAWPVYLIWPLLIAGWVVFIMGVSRL